MASNGRKPGDFMVETRLTVTHKVGLHARPAALFVQTANKFASSIKVKNLTSHGNLVDAKSIIMVLTLGVMKDHEICIQAEGADEDKALAALASLVEANFGEG
jgi:phosphotransferase system HPr (HPr) family protein